MIEEVGLPASPSPPASSDQPTASSTPKSKQRTHLRIAIQGCCHGSLDRIYATLQAREGPPIDLLLCCGDFQAIRNASDLQTLAVPEKYREIGTFWRYYSGQAKAPIPTIFIGGNHEASGYLQELFYGGWVAPNIYYLGAAGVVRFGGLRIGGLSGIYKSHDFAKGRYEMPPYDKGTLRSVYHVRNVEVYRMKCLGARVSSEETSEGDNHTRRPLDIMLSHDWPRGIERHGDTASLLRKKKFFRQEVEDNTLGSRANEDVLHAIKPRWWFSAHLHVKFEATVRHNTNGGDAEAEDRKKPAEASAATGLVPSQVAGSSTTSTTDHLEQAAAEQDDAVDDGRTTSFIGLESSTCPTESTIPDLTEQMTRFLSLDKCLPRRQHLQIVNIPIPSGDANENSDDGDLNEIEQSLHIDYDAEWLAILRKTHNLTQMTRSFVNVPVDITPATQEEIEEVRTRLIQRHRQRSGRNGNDQGEGIETSDSTFDTERNAFAIPENFCITVPPHGSPGSDFASNGGAMVGNPQTDELLDLLGLEHVVTVPYTRSGLVQARPPTPPPHPIMQLTPDDNEIDLDDDEGGEEEKQATVQEVVVEPEIDSNAIDLDDEDELEEDDDDEEDVQTKKARTGS